MASRDGIIEVWAALEAAGLPRPLAWKEGDGLEAALDSWGRLFEDVSEVALLEAARQHAKVSRFWPRPAELLLLLPRTDVEDSTPTRIEELYWQACVAIEANPACEREGCKRHPNCWRCANAVSDEHQRLVALDERAESAA